MITYALPLVLGLLMFGVGLSLTIEDFFKVKVSPKPVALGLLTQLTVCPLIALVVVYAFQLPPAIGIGFMLLSATPGGPSANVFSLLAKGDVALNITMTAVNTLIGAFFILAAVGIVKERALLFNAGFSIFFAVLLFNVINLFLAFYLSKMLKLNRSQSIAITFEVGIHNCVLALAIAVSPDLLNSTEIVIPAVFYSAVMYATSWVAMKIFNRNETAATVPA